MAYIYMKFEVAPPVVIGINLNRHLSIHIKITEKERHEKLNRDSHRLYFRPLRKHTGDVF